MVSKGDARDTRAAMYMCCCPVFAIGCLLTIILLPMSFSKIEYYEAGLLAQKSTGNIDKDTIYTAGNYMIGPDFSFKTFPVSLLNFDQTIAVWSKSGGQDAGATLQLDISFQYRIRTADIGKLYNKVAMSYETLVITYAQDAIKNTSPLYGVDEYLNNRTTIEQALKQNVTKALKTDIFCDVVDLQLRKIGLTADYEQTKLNAALQVEFNGKEEYVQKTGVIEEETSLAVAAISNEALVIKNAAVADANLIKQKAEYEAKKLVEGQRSAGLKLMLSEMGLVTDEHKASLDYITTLINNKGSITPFINLGTDLLQKTV